jgi:hypothetical protein
LKKHIKKDWWCGSRCRSWVQIPKPQKYIKRHFYSYNKIKRCSLYLQNSVFEFCICASIYTSALVTLPQLNLCLMSSFLWHNVFCLQSL